ncbi:MAG TPA: hypothetical protein VFX02_09360 [Gammaproteobacteria bacterium]|nr:hypothetical protein [Gammaproteobacteria bacterium]
MKRKMFLAETAEIARHEYLFAEFPKIAMQPDSALSTSWRAYLLTEAPLRASREVIFFLPESAGPKQ